MSNAIAMADGRAQGRSSLSWCGGCFRAEHAPPDLAYRSQARAGALLLRGRSNGYGLHRLITSLGHPCMVVARSLIPRKSGDRVKTNRRDAVALAKLLWAGELTAVWVPDEGHEAHA